MKPLSVVIIAKNEASVIAGCIDSVLVLADEVVVLDSGSTDSTHELCTSRGVRFIETDWPGFGPPEKSGGAGRAQRLGALPRCRRETDARNLWPVSGRPWLTRAVRPTGLPEETGFWDVTCAMVKVIPTGACAFLTDALPSGRWMPCTRKWCATPVSVICRAISCTILPRRWKLIWRNRTATPRWRQTSKP